MLIKRQIPVEGRSFPYDVPDACPICHRHSEMQVVTADLTEYRKTVQVVLRCAYIGCRSFFICYYHPGQSALIATKPLKPQVAQLPEAVQKMSLMFVQVFAEAEEASQLGLSQIAGPGYRKAFEFLIKDYAKTLAPEKEAEIEAKFSGAVVNEYIAHPRIQELAKRSLWLGNDEAHYLRRWTDHDITDLVTLIRLTASWIEIEHLSKTYIQDMPG